jgi:hypothetical protein
MYDVDLNKRTDIAKCNDSEMQNGVEFLHTVTELFRRSVNFFFFAFSVPHCGPTLRLFYSSQGHQGHGSGIVIEAVRALAMPF